MHRSAAHEDLESAWLQFRDPLIIADRYIKVTLKAS